MRPSDLLLDFGHPVAYYPGLVKYMGSPHAVIFFGQIFYWQDKAHAAEGVHKTREEIQHETGLTFEQQAVARKHLVSRGILVETNKRLEHKMFYRIDCERLNEIINENNQFSRNGETRFRETVKPNFAEGGKPSPRTRETPRRGEGKTNFDLTENTTEITSEITTETKNTIGASADASAPARSARQEYSPEFEQAWQEYPKRAGGNSKSAAFKAWKARIREGIKPETMLDGVKRYAAWIRATGNNGTQFVKQAATFFGPDRHFEEFWQQPAAPGGGRQRQVDVLSGLGAMSDKFGKSSDKLTF
ncbi:TPA: DNA-binding protein [Escherichia coli]|nr:DNA-binding protein [Escherichia coli]HDL9613495.1 DNA-binding protein [Escherichia coli]HDL9615123.1 DNA-binding protein [Escherichia coli]